MAETVVSTNTLSASTSASNGTIQPVAYHPYGSQGNVARLLNGQNLTGTPTDVVQEPTSIFSGVSNLDTAAEPTAPASVSGATTDAVEDSSVSEFDLSQLQGTIPEDQINQEIFDMVTNSGMPEEQKEQILSGNVSDAVKEALYRGAVIRIQERNRDAYAQAAQEQQAILNDVFQIEGLNLPENERQQLAQQLEQSFGPISPSEGDAPATTSPESSGPPALDPNLSQGGPFSFLRNPFAPKDRYGTPEGETPGWLKVGAGVTAVAATIGGLIWGANRLRRGQLDVQSVQRLANFLGTEGQEELLSATLGRLNPGQLANFNQIRNTLPVLNQTLRSNLDEVSQIYADLLTTGIPPNASTQALRQAINDARNALINAVRTGQGDDFVEAMRQYRTVRINLDRTNFLTADQRKTLDILPAQVLSAAEDGWITLERGVSTLTRGLNDSAADQHFGQLMARWTDADGFLNQFANYRLTKLDEAYQHLMSIPRQNVLSRTFRPVGRLINGFRQGFHRGPNPTAANNPALGSLPTSQAVATPQPPTQSTGNWFTRWFSRPAASPSQRAGSSQPVTTWPPGPEAETRELYESVIPPSAFMPGTAKFGIQ